MRKTRDAAGLIFIALQFFSTFSGQSPLNVICFCQWMEAMDLEEQELVAAMRAFNRLYARRLGVFDRYALGTRYSLAQARVLVELGRHPGCTANRIADYLAMDRSYLTRILTGFEEQQLLERRASAADGRKKCLWLRPAGKQAYYELEEKSDAQVRRQLQDLPAADKKRLWQSLQVLAEVLGEGKQDGND